jgi:xanthine dehydrogenase large subunit
MDRLPAGGVGTPLPHDSAHLHVTGEAIYTDDIPEVRGTLHAAIGMSERAHARIKSIDLTKVRAAPGVIAVLTAKDVPGKNDYGPVVADDPIFATTLVQYLGQSIFAVAARTVEEARRAARLAVVEYEDLKPILNALAAVRANSFVLPTERMQRGDPAAAIAAAPHRLTGRVHIGGQDQFYLEGMIAYAVPKEDGTMLVYSSTQHPGEVQHQVAHALDVDANDVVVDCRRMGGGFGGKESQPGLFACRRTVRAEAQAPGEAPRRPRRRHADHWQAPRFRHRLRSGLDGEGRIQGVTFTLAGRCGYSADLSGSINDRAMFHSDNCYYLGTSASRATAADEHRSNTAFRGLGGRRAWWASSA